MRYNHWFWNSTLLDWVSQRLSKLNDWLWHKRYGCQYENNFWHAVDNAMDKRNEVIK